MFSEKDKKKGDLPMNGFVGKGVTITGKLLFEGSIRIDGNFHGEIEAVNGSLIVGEGAHLEAKAKVDSAVISGEYRGDIEGKSRIELRPPGRMFGNIHTSNLIIGEGVIFEGTCEMAERRADMPGVSGTQVKKMGVV